MIHKLKLRNVAIIDECEIDFKPGLNILSGETGAGKSVILQALSCILGARADMQLVSQGAEKACIEAVFDNMSVRREIPGKCWINNESVSLSQLQNRIDAEILSQGAYHTLKSLPMQLKLLDQFGKCNRLPYSEAYAHFLEIGQPFDPSALEEIQSLQIAEDEEKELFAELETMANFQQISQDASGVIQGIDKALSTLSTLKKQQVKHLTDANALIQSALTDLQEAHFQYAQYAERLEYDPCRMQALEERLSAIHTLKRKLGCHFEQLQDFEAELIAQAARHKLAKETLKEQAKSLSKARALAAQELSSTLTKYLQELNMPNATVTIALKPAPYSISGADQVIFSLAANSNETAVPIHQHISGGELSRLMLALKLSIANPTSLLIFDEIDSNIGGETASLIGKQLKELGKRQQLICITHFPQVANFADHHLHIFKYEKENRTHARVKTLSNNAEELERMLGGKSFTKKLKST